MSRNAVGLLRRVSKLRSMSASEVVGRTKYALLVARERKEHKAHPAARQSDLQHLLMKERRGPGWRERLLSRTPECAARFFAGCSDRDQMQRLFREVYTAERAATIEHATDARNNRFQFFGLEFAYEDIDWHADPVTGRRWPRIYHRDVPVNGGDVGYGDVKHVWELNRHQFLIDLAKAHYLGDTADNGSALTRLVSSWITSNPYGIGVNWACALEPAFRAWSWLWAYHLTAGALDDEFHLAWLASFHAHGRFLARHLEHYASPYNHLIGEASALYALGVCFPEFAEAEDWRRQGRAVLEGRLPTQFYADGGSVEQSTFYHHATTGFYLLVAILGRRNGEEFSDKVWAAIERALEFSMWLTEPDGTIPEIGGADDGKPIRLEHLPFWDFRPYLAIGAVLFDRGDFKAVSTRFYEDALWLLGPAGRDSFGAREAGYPRQTTVVLPASGYAISRSGWTPDADYVCFDIGEQAAGMRTDAVPNSMHGHADALSIIVSLNGRRVLVDSGLYAYNCGGEWEAHFRETAAHNTARIDRRDQARHLGSMAWSHSYRVSIHGQGAGEHGAWVTASHDGYARGTQGVVHRRTVWRQQAGYVLVLDEFIGSGAHQIEVNYQFAEGQLTLNAPARAVFADVAEIAWIGRDEWRPELRSGGPGPGDGWICASLGVRQPAPRLTLSQRVAAGSAALLSVIGRKTLHASTVVFDGHRLVAVTNGDKTDWIVARGITSGTAIQMDGALGIYSDYGSASSRERVAHGTSIHADVELLKRIASAQRGDGRT